MFSILAFLICLAASSYSFPLEENRIVNGTNAKLGEIPFIVSLRVNDRHTCGGSIINANWILTAAHCVEGRVTQPFSIQYGITAISSDTKNSIKVTKIIYHENYVAGKGYKNDVAVLKLASAIPFNNNVQPMKLPAANAATPGGATGLLSGWGLPYTGGSIMTNLQKVNLDVYQDADCERIHAQSGPTNRAYHVCAGVQGGGKGQCSGDSGGPLIANGVQVGIVSWSVKPCAIAPYPGVFTKVSSYVTWIQKQIQN